MHVATSDDLESNQEVAREHYNADRVVGDENEVSQVLDSEPSAAPRVERPGIEPRSFVKQTK